MPKTTYWITRSGQVVEQVTDKKCILKLYSLGWEQIGFNSYQTLRKYLSKHGRLNTWKKL